MKVAENKGISSCVSVFFFFYCTSIFFFKFQI